EDQLIQKYENILLKAQQYKAPEREITIFDTALKSHHENPITELLAFFLDPNEKHSLNSGFYDGFIEAIKQHEKYSEFEFGEVLEVVTQQITDKGKFIDLWLETDTALIVVEVKVYHTQNNPFKEYLSWANKKLKDTNKTKQETGIEKKLVLLVFSPNGYTNIEGWLGLSYSDFTTQLKQTLGMQIIKNPLNKWGVFARDFLLHLDSFNESLETDMESLKFVIDNIQKIQELVDLRENVYREIIDHVNNALQIALGEEYEPYVRRHTWSGTPALRFIGNNWKDWSDTVLNLHINRSPMSCSINMYIQNPTDEIMKNVKIQLKKSPYPIEKEWYEGKNNQYWGASWNFNLFDLHEVTKFIVFTQTILNRVETEWK
uniref:PD-(D/E)XK nuclease family protein n=1 Tax=Acinetobacter junii TaxID=40215 RepID=UPI00124F5931